MDLESLKAGIGAAVKAHDGVALDALVVRLDAIVANTLQTECTKACVDAGPNALAARKQGPALVTAFKRCMVSADSTREARKLNAYETDLYCKYMSDANGRCRAASKCDWLEASSALECVYASPGFNCPM
jgi:hypothetical protein